MKKKHDEGFSLVEVLVAIVLLAAFVVPTCSALTMAARMNGRTEELMQAQLDVSSAVEMLLARGVDQTFKENLTPVNAEEYPELTANQVGSFKKSNHESFKQFDVLWKLETKDTYYEVTVVSKDGLVEVKTSVRVVSGGGS